MSMMRKQSPDEFIQSIRQISWFKKLEPLARFQDFLGLVKRADEGAEELRLMLGQWFMSIMTLRDELASTKDGASEHGGMSSYEWEQFHHVMLKYVAEKIASQGWINDNVFGYQKPLLHIAIELFDVDIVSTALSLGANPNQTDGYQSTPLKSLLTHFSYTSLSPKVGPVLECLHLLMSAGALIDNAPDHPALRDQFTELDHEGKILDFLIQHGLDVNLEDRYGMRLLDFAAFTGNRHWVERLIDQGAHNEKLTSSATDQASLPPKKVDPFEKKTAAQWADWRGHGELAVFIRAAQKSKEEQELLSSELHQVKGDMLQPKIKHAL